ELTHALGGHQPSAGAHPHPRHDLLAVFQIGNTDHLHVLNVRVREEELLDLARVHVLPTANDHVFDSPDDVDVAGLVHGGKIAGMHPARTVDRVGGLLRLAPVAKHHGISACAQL